MATRKAIHQLLRKKHQPCSSVVMESACVSKLTAGANIMTKDISKTDGTHIFSRRMHNRSIRVSLLTPHQFHKNIGGHAMFPCFTRSLASSSSSGQTQQQQDGKDISTFEEPFDAPTYNIPEKPVTFVEGASYSVVILAGLGIAVAAGYATCKELIFEPKEYKVFGKALERAQNDSQVRERLGTPIKGYGQESQNRGARQRIPHRTWTDEDGVERVEINFVVSGPKGTGRGFSQMFKDKEDNKWKFTYLIVEINGPRPVQLMLESYLPS